MWLGTERCLEKNNEVKQDTHNNTHNNNINNKSKKLKTHFAAKSCVHQPYERMHAKCALTVLLCMLMLRLRGWIEFVQMSGLKPLFVPYPQGTESIRGKRCLRMIWAVQWLAALICHLVPSTVLVSTNNGVLFLLPFTPRDKWPKLRESLLFVAISAWSLSAASPFGRGWGGGLKNMKKLVFFTFVAPFGTTHWFILFLRPLDSSSASFF